MLTAEELRKKFQIGTTAPPAVPAPVNPAAPKNVLGATAADLRTRFNIGVPSSNVPSLLDTARTRSNAAVKDIESRTSPFLKTLFDTARTYIGQGAQAADRFAADRVRDVREFAEGKYQVSPDDVLSGLGTTGMGAIRLTGALAQGFNEGVFRIGKSGSTAVLGEENTSRIGRLIPRELTESITGRKPEEIDTYQKIFGAADAWAQEKGASRNQATTFAGMAVLGSLFVDNPLVGPGKAAIILTKEASERLAKETAEDVIRAEIRAANPNVPDQVIDFVVPVIQRSQTGQEVQNALRLVNNAAFTASRKTATKNSAERLASEEVPAHIRLLETEARKYKSADDFYKAQPKVFHGSNQVVDAPDVNKGFPRDFGKAFYVARERATAHEYAEAIAKAEKGESPIVNDYVIAPDAKFVKLDRMAYSKLVDAKMKEGKSKNPEYDLKDAYKDINADLVAKGYDGIDTVSAGLAIFNQDKIITRKQLSEIYDRTAAAVPASARPSKEYAPNVNLVREISKTQDKFQILHALEKEFPALTNRTLDRFVNRLARLKRGSDIEGILKAAGKINVGVKDAIQKGSKTLDRTMPKSIQGILSNTEKYAYIAAIKSKVQTPEQAILAKHEYDMVWETADQKVIDRYNDMTMEAEFLEDALSNDNAESLFKKYYRGRDPSDPTMELQELRNRAMAHQKARRDHQRGMGGRKPKPLTKREEALLDVDAEVEGLGYADLDDAWNAIQRHAEMRARVADMRAEMKALKPYVKSAEILRASLDQLPVISNDSVAVIDDLARVNDVLGTYKDISGFSKEARDVYRNFRKFFGTRYDEVKKSVLDPFDDAKGSFVDEVKALGDELETGITKKYGWKRGSKESAAIQRYGDTGLPAPERMNYEDLVNAFGRPKANQIVAADTWFRGRYNRLIGELNEIRKKVYPNNAAMLIPFRKDYYRHFKEIGNDFADALRNLFDTPAGIDPNLAGLSEYTKPKTKFLPFAQQRTGEKTSIDAIGGFVDYMPMFSYAKHIDPQIGTFRYLRRRLAEVAPKPGETVEVMGIPEKANGINNFLVFLDNYANNLAGKSHPLDRWISDTIPGGRQTLQAMDWVNNRIKANTILGNMGSAVAQVANVPVGIASAKQYSARGMKRSIAGIVARMRNPDIKLPVDQSVFLKERYMESPKERFPFDFSERPVKATSEEGRKRLAWILGATDRIGSEFIWNSHYEKYLAENRKFVDGKATWKAGTSPDEAVRYADGITRDLIAGRGVGEVPLGQKARIFQLIAPFQLEVGNFWHVAHDFAKRKDVGAIATLVLANYIFNEAAERARGSRVVYDPINAFLDGSEQLYNETKEGNPAIGALKFAGRNVGEIASNIPIGQSLATALLPEDWRRNYLGNQDPGRFGAGPLPMTLFRKITDTITAANEGTLTVAQAVSDMAKLALQVVLPYGGKQVEKTWEGLQSVLEEEVRSGTGKQNFTVSQTPVNFIKAILFGQYATGEARKFFDEREDLFDRVNRQETDRKRLSMHAEADWKKMKELVANGQNDKAVALLEKAATEDPLLAKRIAEIAADEKKGLNGIDRMVKMLGIENGERAKYIVSEMKHMKPEERLAYIDDLASKKLLSKDVIKQITFLMSQ